MSGQEIGTVVGGIVGVFLAPYTGGASIEWGMAIGGMIGGAVDPTKIKGPHIGQGQQQTATDGVPIAWILGTAKIAGTLIWAGPRREVEVDSGGKGSGTEQVTYEAHQDFAILVCESSQIKGSSIESVLIIEQDGKIVYDIRPESKIAVSSQKWRANKDFMFGGEDQLPHPTMEADTGVGKTPAYRDRLVIVFKDVNLSQFGDRIPSYLFTVASSVPDATTQEKDLTVTTGNEDSGNGYAYSGYCSVGIPIGASSSITRNDLPVANCIRYAFAALYGDVVDGNVELNHSLSPGASFANTVWDSGWLAQNEEWLETALDPPTGSKMQPPSSIRLYSDWLADQTIPFTITFPTSCTGIRLYMQSWGPGAQGGAGSFIVDLVIRSGQANTISLGDVVKKICERGTLSDSQFDITALSTYSISGYTIATQCSGADALQPLLQAVFAFGTEVDKKILFKFYGEDVSITVNPLDAVVNDASGGAVQTTTRNQATEFPQKIVGSYVDPEQNYNTVTQQAERLAQTVIASGETDIQIPIAISATQAKQATDKALKVAYATLEGTINLSVPYATANGAYLKLAAGEPIFEGGKRWVTDEIDIGINYLKISGRYDRQSAYTSNVQPVKGNPPTLPTSQYSGPTDMLVMNLPSLRPQDTYGVYIAVRGQESSWRGATVQVSYDNQQSWTNVVTATLQSVMGTVISDEASSSSSDEANTTVSAGNGQIVSITDEQLAAGQNAFAIVDSSNVPEIRQAKYADELSEASSCDDSNEYLLTHQKTGLNGTDFVLHETGEKFTMLSKVYFAPIDLSFKGKTLYFRAVGFGEVAEQQDVISIIYDPDTTIIVDGGEVT